jgi:putative endonuclease
MKEDAKESGRRGEELACTFLVKKGYDIVKRNFRFGHGEIDIIARKEDLLIFVEVKTRTNYEFGEPELAITKSKQKQIIKIAKAYLYINEIYNMQCRFDVVAIMLEKYKEPRLNHIENAFIEM